MATYTPNLNLKKPGVNDAVDIADINGNMDTLDQVVAGHASRHACDGADPLSPVDISPITNGTADVILGNFTPGSSTRLTSTLGYVTLTIYGTITTTFTSMAATLMTIPIAYSPGNAIVIPTLIQDVSVWINTTGTVDILTTAGLTAGSKIRCSITYCAGQ